MNSNSDLLQKIARVSLDLIGTDFFKSTVKNISESLGLQGVMISEFIEEEYKMKAYAFWFDGKFVENYQYYIKNTPCESAMQCNDVYFIPENVIDFFPDDNDLKEINASSYVGISLRDVDGKVLGHLAALNNKPLENLDEIKSVFEIIAARATLELRRLRAVLFLKDSEEKLNRLVNGTQDYIIEFDQDFFITQANQSAIEQFNLDLTQVGILKLNHILNKDGIVKLQQAVKKLNLSGSTYDHIEDYLVFKKEDDSEISSEATLSFYTHLKEKYYILICKNSNLKIEQENTISFLNRKSEILEDEIKSLYGFDKIIGSSEKLINTLELVRQVAPYNTTVLITGETGTGKELIARAIHNNSSRADQTLVNINCAALPPSVIESELFGHEKGAFTGAVNKRIGRFLLADKGTIFLDEIGELPLDLQAKLLRVLQEGEFESVGSNKTVKVDVRLIAATNRNLPDEVKKGKFREDLYFRLNVFYIPVPPLRERGEDVILLSEFLLKKYSGQLGKKQVVLSEKDKQRLLNYNWSGNIRELQNLMERGVITSNNGVLDIDSLLPVKSLINNSSGKENLQNTDKILSYDELRELEKQNIIKALDKCNWKLSGSTGAATILNIPSSTLASKIKSLNIKKSP